VNPVDARELLERAAAAVTPAEKDAASRMVILGRRSLRRRAWVAAGSVAAVMVAAVAVPFAITARSRSETAASPGRELSFGGVTVAVPKGWKTVTVPMFEPCIAQPNTVYLAARWDYGNGARPSAGPDAGRRVECTPAGKAWLAVVDEGLAPMVDPPLLEVRDGHLLQVEQPDPPTYPSMWAYRPLNGEILATTAFVSGDDKGRDQLIDRVSWPAGPPAPPGGGLALPDRLTSATSETSPGNHMVVATDAKTLNQIRAKLAEQRNPVPDNEECTPKKPGSLGINLGEITVVLGDAACPQAISTGGGRVQVPPGLGQELLGLMVASQDAAAERDKKD
jgi:hypothetical protein